MARLPRGHEVLEKAQKLLEKAVNADDLRMLQAVVLPLVNGMSIQETAKAIGRGATWTTNARNKFIRCGGIPEKAFNKARNRAHMTKDEEAALLAPFFESARNGGRFVRVRGAAKVMAHLMFGIIAMTAKQLFNMLGTLATTHPQLGTLATPHPQLE